MKPRIILACILTLLLIPLTTQAMVPVTCFDQEFFRGTGKPVTESFTFPCITGQAAVMLWNDPMEDLEKVSSAEVYINGDLVFGPHNFNQDVDYLEATVMLNDSNINTIDVTLKSKPGGNVRIAIEQLVDTNPPELVEFDFEPKTIDVCLGPQEVTFTVRVTDDLLGFNYGTIEVISPSQVQSSSAAFYLTNHLLSGDKLDGIYEVSVTFPQQAEAGTWRVKSVVLDDSLNNEAYYEADLIAMGFPTQLEIISECTIDAILDFFDASVVAGTIYGRGKRPFLANFRLWLFRQMLETAKWFIEKDNLTKACKVLNRVSLRCDGEPKPNDFIQGDAVLELSDMILGLMEVLGCE